MTDRTVRVRVVAEMPGYNAAMRAAGADTALLGETAVAAGRGVLELGVDAVEARGGLSGLAAGARGGAVALGETEVAAVSAGRGVRAAAVEAEAATGPFGRMGTAARSGMASAKGGAEGALDSFKHLGLFLAGGTILYGLHDIVHQGNEYADAMNKLQEVTRGSGAQMVAAGKEAQALGADMKLPSASAAEAADAMVELAKAGLSAGDAIKAARGTIQLAAAARTDVATAAKIEGDILDEFSLKAQDATHVADILANTANSASGELMDIYYAMKYVGPTAHSLSIPLQDVATAVGLLGKSGIIGDTAGTSLRGALVNMAKPTKQAQAGLHELGIEAFDSQGKFKGLQYVIEQLHTAQQHLTEQQFTAAAAMAFGKPALSAMTALAHQGGEAFQLFSVQVGRTGGAAALAAAESKGLGGAMRGLGKEISSAFLQIYLAIAPGLEQVTRTMTNAVSSAIPGIKNGIRIATDLWDIYGPTVVGKLSTTAAGVTKVATGFVAPLEGALTHVAVSAIPVVITSVHSLGQVFGNAQSASVPFVAGLHDLFNSAASGSGAFGILAGRVQVGVSALGDASGVLRPLGSIVGALAHDFSLLPGPIQLSVLGMLAMRPFRPQIQALQDTVVGYGRAGVQAFRGIGDASLYQRVLAAGAGQELGRFGGALAELERRSPVISAMATSFRDTSSSIETAGGRLAGFRGAVGGVATAVGTGAKMGLMGAMSGLYSFLGGPWGIAIGGAMMGLDMLAQRQQQAAAAAEAHRARISSLAQALEQSAGHIDAAVRATTVQTLADAKLADGKTSLMDTMSKAGVSATQLTNAYLGQGDSLANLRTKLQAAADATKAYRADSHQGSASWDQGIAFQKAADALGNMTGEVPAAITRQKDLAAAVAGTGSATAAATDPTGRLQKLIDTLGNSASDADTKATALHQALQLLSGGELDVQAATAAMNASTLDVTALWKDGVDQARGYGAALLQVDGSLNTTTQNGQDLWNKLQDLNTTTAKTAQASYDLAKANGDDVPTALKAAEEAMQSSWQTAVTAGEKLGLTADQAKNLAAQMGFIPSYLAITLATKDLDPTMQGLLLVQGLAQHLSAGATVTVQALTDQAVKDLRAVGIQVETLPGGRMMKITAPTDKAIADLNALIDKQIPGKTVDVVAQTAAALADLQRVHDTVAALPGSHHVTVAALTTDALDALHKIGYTTETLPDGRVRVTVPTQEAADGAKAIQDYINGIQDKSVKVTVTTNYTMTGVGPYGGKPQPNANGGYYSAYAAGGITAFAGGTERHVAQIAPAGAMRLWAEPETGGEAYIPLAAGKRARSTAILGKVADRFGYQLIPAARFPAPAAPTQAPAPAGPAMPGGFHIEHYHESAAGSARATAEDLLWLAKTRG